MTHYLLYAFAAIGVLGFAFGAKCYLELWRWAKQCQNARIAIAYNRRVQLDAPLTEWLEWSSALRSQKETGRMVYRNGKMSVSVLAPKQATKTTIKTIRKTRRKRSKAPAPA